MPRAVGKSSSVVQLGAFGSQERVGAAWSVAVRRFASLRSYSPMSARFHGPKGVVYRLSVRGFNSPGQARNLCVSLRRAGGSCFVRSVAGDVPVRIRVALSGASSDQQIEAGHAHGHAHFDLKRD